MVSSTWEKFVVEKPRLPLCMFRVLTEGGWASSHTRAWKPFTVGSAPAR